MKTLLKKVSFIGLMALFLGLSSSAWSVAPIYFEGPKITDKLTEVPGQPAMFFPENFDALDYTPNNLLDLSVPLLRGNTLATFAASNYAIDIIGMDNLNNWSGGINQYFHQDYIYSPPMLRQVATIQANGAATKKDIVIVSDHDLVICYEYNGGSCASISAPITLHPPLWGTDTCGGAVSCDTAYKVSPWRVVVADFDADGHDDVVGIGWAEDYRGVVFHIDINDDATPVIKSVSETKNGIPLSLTAGQFDTTPSLDVVTGIMPYPTGPKAWLIISKNVGGNLEAPVDASEKLDHCYHPTGLVTWNPDANAVGDVVLTCYTQPSALGNGPVITFKNINAAPFPFIVQQTIDKFKAPYESTIADYNGDSRPDIAVADNGASAVVVIAGGGADLFAFDLSSLNSIPTESYTPKFIQTHQMDAAPSSTDLLDIVVTASTVKLPRGYSTTPAGGLKAAKEIYYPVVYKKGLQNTSKLVYGSRQDFSNAIDTAYVFNDRSYAMMGANSYSFKDVSRVQGNYNTANVFLSDGVLDAELRTDTAAVSIADVSNATLKPYRPRHAVLVLLNRRPQIIPDNPTCESVTVHCVPSSGKTIASCTVTTSESWSPNPQVTDEGTGKAVKITLPANQVVHFTVTAVEAGPGGNTYTASFEMAAPACPSTTGAVCPVDKLEASVWVDDPWTLCVGDPLVSQAISASGSTGIQIIWSQTSGPAIFGISNIVAESTTGDGHCMSGRFKFPDDDQEKVVEGVYSIKNTVTNTFIVENCRWKLIQRPALIEGSGFGRCSLDKRNHPPSMTILFWGLMILPLLGFSLLRKREE